MDQKIVFYAKISVFSGLWIVEEAEDLDSKIVPILQTWNDGRIMEKILKHPPITHTPAPPNPLKEIPTKQTNPVNPHKLINPPRLISPSNPNTIIPPLILTILFFKLSCIITNRNRRKRYNNCLVSYLE